MGLIQPVWRLQQCTIMVQESMFSTVLKLGKFNILLTLLLFYMLWFNCDHNYCFKGQVNLLL